MSATYAALDTARKMTEAATRFLETLDAKREALASFPFDSDVRQDWHYVPRSRVGLPRGRMDGTQLESAHALMASGLSAVGARKSEQIIRHESILGRIEGDSAQFLRDPGLYFFNIFGKPPGGRRFVGLAGGGTPSVPELHVRRRRATVADAILLRRQSGRGAGRA